MNFNKNLQDNSDILAIYQNITNLVKIWISGDYKHEHLFEQKQMSNTDMIETKKYFYDMIMNEIKKQLNTTDINEINKKLKGELNVFFDELGILACIVTENSDVSDYECDDYDD